jgi:hypothetical protein
VASFSVVAEYGGLDEPVVTGAVLPSGFVAGTESHIEKIANGTKPVTYSAPGVAAAPKVVVGLGANALKAPVPPVLVLGWPNAPVAVG